jgi:RimJ/RimL family protein N-acetyltransferase
MHAINLFTQTGVSLNHKTSLKNTVRADLPIFFEQQLDEEANHMAAFTAKDPTDRDAFDAHWARVMGDESITLRTIVYESEVAGNIACHSWFGDPEISYWIGKSFWGKGVATEAVSQFLNVVVTRPLYARVVKDNIASIRVLEKCAFMISGHDKGFANARAAEVEEIILRLD